jgi:hypothetical protein
MLIFCEALYYTTGLSEAGVAQLAEQLICNQQVAGSSPITSSGGEVPERPKGADCKSVVSDFGGSNPPLSTILFSFVEKRLDKLANRPLKKQVYRLFCGNSSAGQSVSLPS